MGPRSSSKKGGTTIVLATYFSARQALTRDVSIPETVAVFVILILSLATHEVAHAWVAWKRGDSTAKDLGRITLDPLPHIDLWWTILLPAMLWFGSGGQYVFGGAKPVPVVFQKLKKPHRDMALVAIAGPATNFLIAVFLTLVLKIVSEKLGYWQASDVGHSILEQGIALNLILAAFNLLPIPPLDGSRVLTWLLPESVRPHYMRLESIGLLLVMFFLWGMPNVSVRVLSESVYTMQGWIQTIVTLGGAW